MFKLGANGTAMRDFTAYPPYECRINDEGEVSSLYRAAGPQRPVGDPRFRVTRGVGEPCDLGERDLEFVDRLRAALVDPGRLRRRADEPAREQVGQRRMPLPVGQQRHEQVGTSQQRRIGGGTTAEGDVVPAAGSTVGAVDVECLCGKPSQPGLGVESLQLLALLSEAGARAS